MPRYLARVEYNGGPYHGFQRQPGISTVQGELERALARITGEEPSVQGAGRTDAGVHSVGQAVAFSLSDGVDSDRLLAGLNGVLPKGITVAEVRGVRQDMDPRREAMWREYRYFILNRRAPSALLEDFTHQVTGELDDGLMRRACGLMVGVHDFQAFCVKGGEAGTTVRNVMECDVSRARGDILCIRVKANAFLYRMVRSIVGAVVRSGSGALSLEEIGSRLAADSPACAEPLPAKGLFLWRVEYPDDIWLGP